MAGEQLGLLDLIEEFPALSSSLSLVEPGLGRAEIGEHLAERLLGIAPVHVAQGDDVLAGQRADVVCAHAANAYAGNVQAIAGGCVAGSAKDMTGHDKQAGRGDGRAGEEFTTRGIFDLRFVSHALQSPPGWVLKQS
ncbi:hypothetical protein ACVWWJ_001958 [Luteibacter sp. HA06]